jgi:hypothetical protein
VRNAKDHVIHHPAFQSLFLPLLLALLGISVLWAGLGARHAAWGGLLGLLGALAWLPGFEWPTVTRTQKLPWIVLAGLGLAALDALRGGANGRPALAWLAALLAWAAAGLWLAGAAADPLALAAAAMLGWAVLSLLAWGRGDAPAPGALAAAVLTLATLGLAGLAATGGSLLLAQLALMLASTVAAAGCWAWLRPASGLVVSPALLMCFGLAWLSIAWSWVLAAPAPAFGNASAVRVAILTLAFLVPAMLPRLRAPARAKPWLPWTAVLLAAVPVVLAVAWPGGIQVAPMPDTAADPDDLYLTPSWR